MEGESDVGRVAVLGLEDVDLHTVDVQDVPGIEDSAPFREASVVGGDARSEVSLPFQDGRGAVEAAALLPSSVGHAFDDRFRI
jgi:hypothetical protein